MPIARPLHKYGGLKTATTRHRPTKNRLRHWNLPFNYN